LLIVESPSKIAKIQSYLGTGYYVTASCGHLRTVTSLKDIDIKNQFRVDYQVIESKRTQVEQLRHIVGRFPPEQVVLATDNDREGEAIAYHLCVLLDLPVETTRRIVFNEITQSALQYAVQHPIRVNMSLVYSAMARQVVDVLIGFKVSPMLWKHVYASRTHPLSAGRCQTPALRLVYDHYLSSRASEATSPTMTYHVTAHLTTSPHPCAFRCVPSFDGADASLTRAFMEATQTHIHRYLGMGEGKASVSAPPSPLNTSRLLQRASSALHWSPTMVMATAQQLYQQGRITYMRTESTQYSQEFVDAARAYIQGRWKRADYVGSPDKLVNTNTQLPHEAVRVTDLQTTDITEGDAEGRCVTLYKFLWRHTLESCMAPATAETHVVRMSAPGDVASLPVRPVYEYMLELPTFLGWKAVASADALKLQSEQAAANRMYFQTLAKETVLVPSRVEARAVERGRNAHYTEAGLVQALEDRGIGRPSTYASFVEIIQERGYVTKRDVAGTPVHCTEYVWRSGGSAGSGPGLEEIPVVKTLGAEKGKLVLEPVGLVCIEFLLQHFGDLFAYSYTESMERMLDAPMTEYTWYGICQQTLEDLDKSLAWIQALSRSADYRSLRPVYRLSDTDWYVVILQESGLVLSRVQPATDSAAIAPEGGYSAAIAPEGGYPTSTQPKSKSKSKSKSKPPSKQSVFESEPEPAPESGNTTTKFVPIRSDVLGNLDVARLRQGNYTFSELAAYPEPYLGDHEGQPVHLRSGPYGVYVQHGETTKSLKDVDGDALARFTLADAVMRLTATTEPPQNPSDPTSKIMRVLDDCGGTTASIRRGKYGCYVYYCPSQSPKPQFISLKKFKGDFFQCDPSEVLAWAVSGGKFKSK
jgi:DNA topoisomerase-1